MERRSFIRTSALSTIALTIPAIRSFGSDFPAGFTLPKRALGKTGEKLSVIGFGGIMLNNNPEEFAREMIAKAWDMGVNYYDVAPGYGNAQEKMGPALKNYRKKCFLACKTQKRDAQSSMNELHDSLKKLETDHFDLYQLHALSSVEEVEKAFGPGGVMETIEKAKKEGKFRFVGFSAHNVDAAMLAMKNYNFDSILFPINFACWEAGDFGPQVYEEAQKKGMGVLALKSMAMTRLKQGEKKLYSNVWYRPIPDDETMKLGLKFTLSKKITAAIPPGEGSLFLKAIEFMKDFRPITEEESKRMEALARQTEPIFKRG